MMRSEALPLMLVLPLLVAADAPKARPTKDADSHWAFVAPQRPAVPRVNNSQWVRNPIDAFIAARHEEHGLVALARAGKNALLRRVYLDLIGLPPTREQLHAFLSDASPDAYEKVVDQLLASPHYGERWGRHWMDVWRYSDWYGRRQVGDVRNSYPHIWRWRDWIVGSLNADQGYDEMVRLMLAADEIDPENDANIVALGFVVRNWFSLNYDQWMKDLVEHTGKAFLGIRMNCAHCHDHKYDPITQEEYFRFRAFFEPLELRHDRVPGGPPLTKYKRYTPGSGASLKPIAAGLARVFDENVDAKTYMYRLGDARDRFDRSPVAPGAPAVVGGGELEVTPVALPPSAWYPGLKPFVQRAETAKRETALRSARAALAKAKFQAATELAELAAQIKQLGETLADEYQETDKGRKTVSVTIEKAQRRMQMVMRALQLAEARATDASAQLDAIRARIAADQVRFLDAPGDAEEASRRAARAQRFAASTAADATLAQARNALAQAEMKAADDPKAAEAVGKAQRQVTTAQKAAVETDEKLASESSEYTPLSPTYPQQSSGRRAALAKWIGSNDNPLTARVAVNHLWLRHFGRPLVESVFDFGRGGKTPSHPKLLDWLAVEFMQSGWSMKHLHRLIVTSSAYQMQSNVAAQQPANLAIDKDNRYWWRFERRRVEAETVRDSILHAAGALDLTLGGQELTGDQHLHAKRRSLYFAIYPEGGGSLPFTSMFDAPDPCDCYRRSESIVPQQALAMTNSRLMIEASRRLAERLRLTMAGDVGTELLRTSLVTAAFEQILSRPPEAAELKRCLAFWQRQEQLYRESPGGSTTAEPDARALQSLVRVLYSHNDFAVVP